jgi:acetolactate synthase-1/3 small subunit
LNLALQRQALIDLAKAFDGVVADIGFESITIQICARTSKIDTFINLLKPFGIIEVARSGAMAIARSQADVESKVEDEISTVDATQLPPG